MNHVVLTSVQIILAGQAAVFLSSCGFLGIHFGSSPTEIEVPKETSIQNVAEDPERLDEAEGLLQPIEPSVRPTAKPVAGRPGFVVNPFTGNVVDVRGLGAGLLVRDPEDSDRSHTFRVPEFE